MEDSMSAQAAEAPQVPSNYSTHVSCSGLPTLPVNWLRSFLCSSSKTAVLHTTGTPQLSAYKDLKQNKISWI